MSNLTTSLPFIAAALTLGACATPSAGPPGPPPPPAPVNQADLGFPVTLEYNISNGDVSLNQVGELPVVIFSQLTADPNIREYRTGGGIAPLGFAAAMTTHSTSSGISAGRSSVYFSGSGATNSFRGAQVSRLAPANMPTSGTANFTGDYTGYLVRLDGYTLFDIIRGDASLDADFAGAATISGTITNRAGSGSTYGDITLNPAALSPDGSFIEATNTTSGGGRQGAVSSQTVASAGTYRGFILTDSADTVVGILGMDQESVTIPATSYREFGAFSGQ